MQKGAVQGEERCLIAIYSNRKSVGRIDATLCGMDRVEIRGQRQEGEKSALVSIGLGTLTNGNRLDERTGGWAPSHIPDVAI